MELMSTSPEATVAKCISKECGCNECMELESIDLVTFCDGAVDVRELISAGDHRVVIYLVTLCDLSAAHATHRWSCCMESRSQARIWSATKSNHPLR